MAGCDLPFVETVTVGTGKVNVAFVDPDAVIIILEKHQRTDAVAFQCTGVADENILCTGTAFGLRHNGELSADGLFESQLQQFSGLFHITAGAGIGMTVGDDDLIA